jgi:hypothetical protein
MVTVKMTEIEYEAYVLYLKSIKLMLKAEIGTSSRPSMEKYLSDPENLKEFEAGLDDINAGRITYIDTDNLWASIK